MSVSAVVVVVGVGERGEDGGLDYNIAVGVATKSRFLVADYHYWRHSKNPLGSYALDLAY